MTDRPSFRSARSVAVTLPDLLAAATPGPWVPIVDDDCEAWVDSATNSVQVVPRPTEHGYGVTDSDAALIALAPEMAALLIEARDYVKEASYSSGRPGATAADLLARIDGLTDRRQK